MKKLFTLSILLIAIHCVAQDKTRGEDPTKTIHGIVNEGLKIITGDSTKVRDWEAFRDLFTADATFTVLSHDTTGSAKHRTFSLEAFVRIGRRGYERYGFIETEVKKTVDEYNGIAQVFQSYYAKGREHEELGINSYQLINDGTRWWITSIVWTDNTNGVELPVRYQPD